MPTKVTAICTAGTARRKGLRSIRVTAILALACVICNIFINPASANTGLHEIMQAIVADPPTIARRESAREANARYLEAFYGSRGYEPAWLSERRLADLDQLRNVVRSHGLPNEMDMLAALSRQLVQARSSVGFEAWAKFDVVATLTIAKLICDLRFGQIDPARLGAKRAAVTENQGRCGIEFAQDAARSDSLVEYLDGLAPSSPLYRSLRLSLAAHRLAAQGSSQRRVPPGKPLKIGMADDRVLALRERLRRWPAVSSADEFRIYDDELATTVRAFQTRHRLDSDGILGKRTITALNITPQDRVDQLRVNMEWQRWALSDQQSDYLLVNVAHYTAHLIHDGAAIWSGRIQVGRSDRPTPSFKAAITSIVVNPSWTVPPTIFRKDPGPRQFCFVIVELLYLH